MLYIIDTANIEDIKRLAEYYPIDGVTTNPTIISKEHTDFLALIKNIRGIIGDQSMFHIQVTGETSDKMIYEARKLREYVGGNFYVKIPICEEGLKATMKLKEEGFNVTMTAIFTQQQALIAAKAGADFVAPYVNRLDNIVSDGVSVVTETVEMFEKQKIPCRVLAASFKTVEQIHKVAMAGCQAVTISADLFSTLMYHPMTTKAIYDFSKDWESVYGKASIADMFKEE